MKKNIQIFLSLFVFLFLFENVTPLCENITPGEGSESKCLGEAAADSTNEECCYLEGFSKTYQGDEAEKECVEIKKSDVQNNAALELIIYNITRGKYWQYAGYNETYLEIDKVVCKNSRFEKSECETNYDNPSGYEDCKNLKTKNDKEICCFLDGGEGEGTECVDIMKSDQEKLEEIEHIIEHGEYWPDYTKNYADIKSIKCKSNSNGLSYIKYSGIMALLIIIFNLF